MNIDWAALSRLVPESVMVIIVLVFVWQTSVRQDRKDERRDKSFIEALADHDKRWEKYLENEQLRQDKAVETVVVQVDKLASLITVTNALIVQHDAWERAELDRHPQHRGDR